MQIYKKCKYGAILREDIDETILDICVHFYSFYFNISLFIILGMLI